MKREIDNSRETTTDENTASICHAGQQSTNYLKARALHAVLRQRGRWRKRTSQVILSLAFCNKHAAYIRVRILETRSQLLPTLNPTQVFFADDLLQTQTNSAISTTVVFRSYTPARPVLQNLSLLALQDCCNHCHVCFSLVSFPTP